MSAAGLIFLVLASGFLFVMFLPVAVALLGWTGRTLMSLYRFLYGP